MSEWWKTFFDETYLKVWGQFFSEETNETQSQAIWEILDLKAGSRVLDAPCGQGRISAPLARRGAHVVGADQSQILLNAAEERRGELSAQQLRFLRHDLRNPLPEGGFDAAINVFTSFGYGTEEEDIAIFRNLRDALRPGGQLLVETNHRDLMCAYISRGSKGSLRLGDGTLFIDEPEFDALAGIAHLHWYWSGPPGTGERHAEWRVYCPTELIRLLQRAGLQLVRAHAGLSIKPYKAEGQDAGGRLALVLAPS